MNNTARRTPLAERLMVERAAKGWTQDRLASEAGMSPSTLANIEAGNTLHVRPGTLHKLAEALGVETMELLRLPQTSETE